MDDREIVAGIRAILLERLGKDRYEVWFGQSVELGVEGESLVAHVPNQFFQDWLRTNFRQDLERAVQEVAGRPLAVEFRIVAREAPSSTSPNGKPVKEQTPPACGRSSSPAPKAPPRREACLGKFVVGQSNCLAHKAAQIVAAEPGSYSPLLLYGPTGIGKSHLLEGVVAEFRRARPRASAIYLSAEQFTSYFVEALHGSGLPSFRHKYRGVDLLAIDDVHFFAQKKATLGELVHTIDTLLRAGKQLLFAADRSPAGLKAIAPDVAARLAGGMVCRIEPAEFAVRLGIVQQLSTLERISLPTDVAHYIASQLTSQSRELAGALKRLRATSLAHSRPITMALAEEALSDLIDHPGRMLRLADIDKAVCQVFGLNPESLQSPGKTKTVSYPRMLAMWLARKHTRAALSEIGAYFGRRSHSTVISAQKKVDGWMAEGASLEINHRTLGLEETIRRVEERLRTGTA